MNIKFEQIPLLECSDIEVKVKQVSEKGCVLLLYKTARTDYRILNKLFGLYNWKCDYKEIKGNLFCTISIYDEEKHEWIEKQNVGIESREDEEGNEKKGEASDSLKRAGFTLGIGLELYSAPFIFVKSDKVEVVKKDDKRYELKDRYEKFYVNDIEYDDDRKISYLSIVNSKKVVVYTNGRKKSTLDTKAPKEVTSDGEVVLSEVMKQKIFAKEIEEQKEDEVPYPEVKSDTAPNVLSKLTSDRLNSLYNGLTEEQKQKFIAWIQNKFNKFAIRELSEFEAILSINALEKSFAKK